MWEKCFPNTDVRADRLLKCGFGFWASGVGPEMLRFQQARGGRRCSSPMDHTWRVRIPEDNKTSENWLLFKFCFRKLPPQPLTPSPGWLTVTAAVGSGAFSLRLPPWSGAARGRCGGPPVNQPLLFPQGRSAPGIPRARRRPRRRRGRRPAAGRARTAGDAPGRSSGRFSGAWPWCCACAPRGRAPRSSPS